MSRPSCTSDLSADDETLILICEKHGAIETYPMLWRTSLSIEHVYARWLKHLMEES